MPTSKLPETDEKHRAARRTQAQRRSEAERRVLDATMALIARKGSHAVTLAQVGEAAGYSRGIVTHHFGSREKLLEAVMRDAQRFPVPDYSGNALEWLAALVRAYLTNVTGRTPAARAFLQMWGEAIAADPVLMPIFAEQDKAFRSLLADRIRVGIGDGSIRPNADPAAGAVLIVALVRGIGMQLIATPAPRNVSAIIDEAVRSTLNAFGA